ncbi:MJ0042 family finger-like domain-containing protein [Malonomonas rubra DSM 5091]|uniref:MJ0042 family finger-like domain-containing protein n=1 Tax=Malonomonas rubra DSM 5091 TaxID=1122189 RepID=A0A1M6I4D2_MALRU|nr:DUF898 family protein [Malonomonas rubra]SHJ29316.1 MJ0042 family finger-like domain-containing protein [Malonomonas rubra DSM 5091]
MSQVLIRCPHCGYSKKMAEAKVPAKVTRVKCPQCGQGFSMAEAVTPAAAPQPAPDSERRSESPAAQTRAASVPAERQLPRSINFVFRGDAKEYFGIWIVNTLLKIVTLGIYSPWAKVRKRSYFYRCTQLEGMNFDYLANPITLLKGWLVGAALFLLYTLGANFSPVLSSVVGLIIFVIMPWAIVRSRIYNSRNSAHRNICFGFYPDYRGAYIVYIGLSALASLTLGLAAPYMIFRQKQFLVDNSSFGRTNFRFNGTAKDFYRLFLRGIGIVVLVIIASGAMIGIFAPMLQGVAVGGGVIASMLVFFFPLTILLAYLFVILYFYVRITNLTWDNTQLGKHRFRSSLKIKEMAWLYFSNGLAIMFSFGLLTPWATIRLTRYRLENLTMIVDGDLDAFEAFNRQGGSAVGEQIGDIFDMDIGF